MVDDSVDDIKHFVCEILVDCDLPSSIIMSVWYKMYLPKSHGLT